MPNIIYKSDQKKKWEENWIACSPRKIRIWSREKARYKNTHAYADSVNGKWQLERRHSKARIQLSEKQNKNKNKLN